MKFRAKVNEEDRVCCRLVLEATSDDDEELLHRFVRVMGDDCVESMIWLSEFFAEAAKAEVQHIERNQGKES